VRTMIREGVKKAVERCNLTYQESSEVMKEIMSGSATQAQIGAFLTALRMKGETVDEVSAFASAMREFCHNIRPDVRGRITDTCGTGGDKLKTFNVSTASAFVAAGAGVIIAKHGNRSVTSKSGSADVLEVLGLNLNQRPEDVKKAIEDVGIGFMFAPVFHPAMKYAVGPRREIGIRTVFNILGPLTNPANAKAQLLGVFDLTWLSPLAYALERLRCEEAMVVHGLDGVDEISTIGKTAVAWLKNGEVTFRELSPPDFGMKVAKPEEVLGDDPEKSAEITFRLLNGDLGSNDPKMDMLLVNSSAVLVVADKVDDLKSGVSLASESIESGAAYKKLKDLIKASNGDLSKLEELEKRYA